MRHLRRNIAGLCVAMMLFAGLAAWAFTVGETARGLLAVIVALYAMVALTALVRGLVRSMSSFVAGLEMNDTTMKVEAGGDSDMREMAASMNRLSALFHDNMSALETRKLYYDRILRVMTHEMRNSITPVISVASDMERHPERYRGEAMLEAAALIREQGCGIKRFLDSYYHLTHLPAPDLTEVRASEFFESVHRAALTEMEERGLANEQLALTVPTGMTMTVDTDLTRQLLTNLLRNAFDAIAGQPDGKVTMTVTTSDGAPYIEVADNGPGIPQEVMANLFQPFFTTKEGGSGIGLCLSRQIARLHGGDLTLRSIPGHGTTAALTL